jgi:hypothetical protein
VYSVGDAAFAGALLRYGTVLLLRGRGGGGQRNSTYRKVKGIYTLEVRMEPALGS